MIELEPLVGDHVDKILMSLYPKIFMCETPTNEPVTVLINHVRVIMIDIQHGKFNK